MKRTRLVLLVSVGSMLVIWISAFTANHYAFRYGIKFQEQTRQEYLLRRMRESGVPYKIGKNNSILYRKKDKGKLAKILSEMETALQVATSCIRFTSPSRTKHFALLLKKYKIPYKIKRSETKSESSLCWPVLYEKQVRKILEKYENVRVPIAATERVCFANYEDIKTFTRMLRKEGIPFRVTEMGSGFTDSRCNAVEIDAKYLKEAGKVLEDFIRIKKNKGSIIKYFSP